MQLHLAEIATEIAPGVTPSSSSIGPAGIPPAGSMSRQLTLDPTAGQMPRAQSVGEHLAVPARQLALQPGLPQSQTISSITAAKPGTSSDRPTLAHHVHRNARLDPQVLINASWYKAREPRSPRNSHEKPDFQRCRTATDLAARQFFCFFGLAASGPGVKVVQAPFPGASAARVVSAAALSAATNSAGE